MMLSWFWVFSSETSCLTQKVICSHVIFYFPLPVLVCFPAIFLAPLCSFLSNKACVFPHTLCQFACFCPLISPVSLISVFPVLSSLLVLPLLLPVFLVCPWFALLCLDFFPFCTFGICFLFLVRFLVTCLLWIADLFSSKPAFCFSACLICVSCVWVWALSCVWVCKTHQKCKLQITSILIESIFLEPLFCILFNT